MSFHDSITIIIINDRNDRDHDRANEMGKYDFDVYVEHIRTKSHRGSFRGSHVDRNSFQANSAQVTREIWYFWSFPLILFRLTQHIAPFCTYLSHSFTRHSPVFTIHSFRISSDDVEKVEIAKDDDNNNNTDSGLSSKTNSSGFVHHHIIFICLLVVTHIFAPSHRVAIDSF